MVNHFFLFYRPFPYGVNPFCQFFTFHLFQNKKKGLAGFQPSKILQKRPPIISNATNLPLIRIKELLRPPPFPSPTTFLSHSRSPPPPAQYFAGIQLRRLRSPMLVHPSSFRRLLGGTIRSFVFLCFRGSSSPLRCVYIFRRRH